MFKNKCLIWIESTVRFQNAGALIDFMQSYITTRHLGLQNWMKRKNCLHFFSFSSLHNMKFCLHSFEMSCYINKTRAHCAWCRTVISGYISADLDSRRANTHFVSGCAEKRNQSMSRCWILWKESNTWKKTNLRSTRAAQQVNFSIIISGSTGDLPEDNLFSLEKDWNELKRKS